MFIPVPVAERTSSRIDPLGKRLLGGLATAVLPGLEKAVEDEFACCLRDQR
jgi:hypothetical protein